MLLYIYFIIEIFNKIVKQQLISLNSSTADIEIKKIILDTVVKTPEKTYSTFDEKRFFHNERRIFHL